MQQMGIIPLIGGLDQVTTPISIPPGFAISAQNYESEVRGYRRISGYEVFDGRPAPSDESYWTLSFTDGVAAFSAGDQVTGATSGANGTVLVDVTPATGSYAGSDAAGIVPMWNMSGTFVDGENLQVSASTVAVADGTAAENGATIDTDHSTYGQAAINARRATIGRPAGSGPIRGVLTYSGDVYAFRDNAGATACVMHKATSSGWVAQTFGHTITFDTGTATFNEGQTLTGGTSGATATIDRAILISGTYGGGDAAGYLVISSITGTFNSSETITDNGSSPGSATSATSQVAITLSPGGIYRGLSNNFYATDNFYRMYVVNGVDRAFEWNGTVCVPIHTGLSVSKDKPDWIAEYKSHLFLGFEGGSVFFSGTGTPTSFAAIDGAGEIGFGETLTGLLESASTALVILGRNKVGYLTGSTSADFNLRTISDDSGAVAETAQVVGQPLFMDDRGIRNLSTSESFGDWRMGSVTRLVETFFANKMKANVAPVGSLRVRSKDQYRVFFSDKSVMSIYFGRKNPECMPFDLDIGVSSVTSGETTSGEEILLAGSDEGWVYQLDKGTSFNGNEIPSHIRFAYNHMGSLQVNKRFHRVLMEIEGDSSTALSVSADYSYGDPDLVPGPERASSIKGGGGYWDESVWGDFYWSGMAQGEALSDLYGYGKNISIAVKSTATFEQPHTLSSMTIFYTMRRQAR